MAHQPGWHPYNIKPGRKNCRQVLTHIKISPRTCLILRQWFGTQAGQRLRLTEYLFSIQCKTRLLLYLTKICIHKRISLIQLNSVIQSAYTSLMWNLWFPLVRTPGGLPNAVSSCYSCVVQSNNKAGVEGYQPWGYYIRIWQESIKSDLLFCIIAIYIYIYSFYICIYIYYCVIHWCVWAFYG